MRWMRRVWQHQPDSCAAYPADGKCSFQDIYLEVDYQPVKPTWVARQETPACDSKATVVSPSQIDFTVSTIPFSAPALPTVVTQPAAPKYSQSTSKLPWWSQ